MHTGRMELLDAADQSYLAQNPRFNPRTKQIFAALNYGRRPHGSSITYGHSHMVLQSGLKQRAFYYPTDTFDVYTAKLGASVQTPFARLGTIYGKSAINRYKAGARFREAVLAACYDGKAMQDVGWAEHLLEAHLFGEVRFREHVSHMVISYHDFAQPSLSFVDDDDGGPVAPDLRVWRVIVQNARDFAERHGIKLYQMD